MAETIKQAAARLGVSVTELKRRIDKAQAEIRRNTAALDLPSGYEPGSHKLRLPDRMARASGELRAQWIRPGQGRPPFESPLEKAVNAHEKRVRAEACHSLRTESAKAASAAAADKRTATGKETAAKVEALAGEGKPAHVIAKHVGKTSHRVRQILATSKKRKSP